MNSNLTVHLSKAGVYNVTSYFLTDAEEKQYAVFSTTATLAVTKLICCSSSHFYSNFLCQPGTFACSNNWQSDYDIYTYSYSYYSYSYYTYFDGYDDLDIYLRDNNNTDCEFDSSCPYSPIGHVNSQYDSYYYGNYGGEGFLWTGPFVPELKQIIIVSDLNSGGYDNRSCLKLAKLAFLWLREVAVEGADAEPTFLLSRAKENAKT